LDGALYSEVKRRETLAGAVVVGEARELQRRDSKSRNTGGLESENELPVALITVALGDRFPFSRWATYDAVILRRAAIAR